MWMRDSSNQLQSYKNVLASDDKVAKLFRGAINLQARYMRKSPYCNAFQPPPESGIPPTFDHADGDVVKPEYDPDFVFECKYEIDSLAAFLQLSYDYYHATDDAAFFAEFSWKEAVRSILDVSKGLMEGTYAEDGSINVSPYTWARKSTASTETVANKGTGEPVNGNIGLVRSFFRPSDDSCIFQYFIPGNMMLARYLKATADIMDTIDEDMSKEMRDMATGIEDAIEEHAIVQHPKFGKVYAYEINGFGSYSLMVAISLPNPSLPCSSDENVIITIAHYKKG
jgi:meiotically up-regulated gene 157 (Mug157) protein